MKLIVKLVLGLLVVAVLFWATVGTALVQHAPTDRWLRQEVQCAAVSGDEAAWRRCADAVPLTVWDRLHDLTNLNS